MQVIKSTDPSDGVSDLSARLNSALTEGKKILWLISGGSNINSAVKIMNEVPEKHSDQLTISLIDERYGEPGHQDSNFQQLLIAGFNPKRANLIPVLKSGLDLEHTAKEYEKTLENNLSRADLTIGLLGIGEDCHIAGILPNSNAAIENERYVTAYKSETYNRITTTFTLLQELDIVYAFAFGLNKITALKEVTEGSYSAIEKPAIILRDLKEAYLYSDQVGEEKHE
jgi:6-phosphogluconolactonase/glucosamine-6-phosphate isomerase/deaminase